MLSISFYLLSKFLKATSVNSPHTPRSVPSEIGLLCLHISSKRVSSLKRISTFLRNILCSNCSVFRVFINIKNETQPDQTKQVGYAPCKEDLIHLWRPPSLMCLRRRYKGSLDPSTSLKSKANTLVRLGGCSD